MVDNNDIIDPEEVFLGEDNKPLGENDFGGNPKPASTEEEPPGDADLFAPLATNDPLAGDANPEGDSDRNNYSNPAEYAMRWLGHESDEIDFGDGVKVKLNELTPEQQSDVLLSQLENVVDAYEVALKEANSGTPQLQDDFQKQVWEFLQSNGDPKQLAQFILDNDPESMSSSMSSEDIVKRHLTETMGLEGEELEEEVKFLKDGNRLDAYSTRARKYFSDKGTDLSGLTDSQRSQLAAYDQIEIQKYEDEKTKVMNLSTKVKDLSGIPVTKEINDFIATQITPKSYKEDSDFVKNLDNPEKLYRLAFLDNYFEDIVDNLKQTYFEMGKSSIAPASDNLSKEPIRVRSFRSQGTVQRPSAVTKDGKIDFDALLKADVSI